MGYSTKSNSNYIILAKVVEQVTGDSFTDYSNAFFQKLGMEEILSRFPLGQIFEYLLPEQEQMEGCLIWPSSLIIHNPKPYI